MFRTRKSHAMSVHKIDDRAVSELLGWLLRMRRRERDRIQDPIQRPTYCANQNQPAPVASDPLSEFHFPSSSSRIRSDNLRSNASVRYPRNNQPKHNPLRNRKKQASFISSPLVLGYEPRLPGIWATPSSAVPLLLEFRRPSRSARFLAERSVRGRLAMRMVLRTCGRRDRFRRLLAIAHSSESSPV